MAEIDLQVLKRELAEKQQAMDEANDVASEASAAYLLALTKWQDEHVALVEARNNTDETARTAKAEFGEMRKRTIGELSKHFADHPEDKTEVDAFKFIRRKEPVWIMADPVKTLIEAGASFLLKVDDSALQAFVNNMSEDKDDIFELPIAIRNWLPGLRVHTAIKGTVSDNKLAGSTRR